MRFRGSCLSLNEARTHSPRATKEITTTTATLFPSNRACTHRMHLSMLLAATPRTTRSIAAFPRMPMTRRRPFAGFRRDGCAATTRPSRRTMKKMRPPSRSTHSTRAGCSVGERARARR